MTEKNKLSPLCLLDGGLGTTLADQFSITFDSSTPLWSSQLLITDPKTLEQAQTSFVNSGADVLITVTYQASFEGFSRSGVDERDAGKYMRSAVEIARKSFQGSEKKGQVALSLGAYGATMIPGQEYTGKYDEGHVTVEQLREWHLKRIRAFFPGTSEDADGVASEKKRCWESVDLVAFETLPLLREVEAAREVMVDVSVILPEQEQKDFWICCVFPGDESLLPDGSSVKQVVRSMLAKKAGSATPMGIGLNCTKVPKVEGLILEFEEAVRELIESGETYQWPALVFYPDGTDGEVYNTTTKVWEKKSEGSGGSLSWDEALHGIVQRAQERELWNSIYVGGCCKTTPQDIESLRDRMNTT